MANNPIYPPYTFGPTYTSGAVPNGGYTVTTSGTSMYDTYTYGYPSMTSIAGDLAVAGDIKINGKSLAETLDAIERRIGIMHSNSELEERWTDLKELADKYRELEKELIEKEAVWNILKK